MSVTISDEIHALCRRYQALALSEDECCLNVALAEKRLRHCYQLCVSLPVNAFIWNSGQQPG